MNTSIHENETKNTFSMCGFYECRVAEGARKDDQKQRRHLLYIFSQENTGPVYAAALQEIRAKDQGNNIVFSCRVSFPQKVCN